MARVPFAQDSHTTAVAWLPLRNAALRGYGAENHRIEQLPTTRPSHWVLRRHMQRGLALVFGVVPLFGHNDVQVRESGKLDVYVYSVPGEELIEITNYGIELVKEVEYDTDIGILYTRWRYLGSPPHKRKFRPQNVNAACFRVSSDLPRDYVYTSTDESTQILTMRKFGTDLLQKQTMDDLLLVKESCEPRYQQVIHRIEDMEICFRRILLPVIGDDNKVEFIYSTTRRFGTVRPEFFEFEMA